MTHPKGVSRIEVSGTVSVRDLKGGMMIRLLGKVDEHAHGAAPIDALAIVSVLADHRYEDIEPGKVQTIVGRIERISSKQLVVLVPQGKVRRLTFLLADNAIVTVDSQTIDLIGPGDSLEASGPLYTGAGVGSLPVLFAEQLIAQKVSRLSPENAPAGR